MRFPAVAAMAIAFAVSFPQLGAADEFAAPWSGPYIGANIGASVRRDEITTTTTPGNFATPAFAPALDAATPVTLKDSGVMGGVQIGYNWQFGHTVLGLEADANWLDDSASRSVTFGPLGGTAAGTFIANTSRISFLSTLRGRLGWAFNGGLLYGTAGLAFARVETHDILGFPANFYDDTDKTETRTGWTVGGGAEFVLTKDWTLKAEYLYVDLGTQDVALYCGTGICPGGAVDSFVHHDITDNIIRIGVNYQLDPMLWSH